MFKRTDPGAVEQIPEIFGNYVYFVKEKGDDVIYCRHSADIVDSKNLMSPSQQEDHVEVVLDFAQEVPWIPQK